MLLSIQNFAATNSLFVTVEQERFMKNGKEYTFLGTNFWQGMNLGSQGLGGDRAKLIRELDHLNSLGIKQLRILALSEGTSSDPYRIIPAVQTSPTTINETLLQGLDFLLDEMKKRDMTAVICLSNFWPWSGGFAQWVSWFEKSSIPYPPPHPNGSWSTFQEYSSRFYSIPNAVKAYQESVKKIVTRVNTISQMPYTKDPTIMSWQLANEPRGANRREEFLKWVRSTAKMIKQLDQNHLITIGSEGETLNPQDAGNNFIVDHSIEEIDYATFHLWVENWGIYNPLKSKETFPKTLEFMKSYINDHVTKAKSLKKPIVMEEFGLARDQRSMDPKSSTSYRDQYYENIFKLSFEKMVNKTHLRGVNFWAWSGENKPRTPYGSLWKQGDDLIGDPPHEEQGWYGVYKEDLSTLKVIKTYTKKLNQP